MTTDLYPILIVSGTIGMMLLLFSWPLLSLMAAERRNKIAREALAPRGPLPEHLLTGLQTLQLKEEITRQAVAHARHPDIQESPDRDAIIARTVFTRVAERLEFEYTQIRYQVTS